MRKRFHLLAFLNCCLLLLLSLNALSAQSPKMKEALQPYIDQGQMPGIVSVLITKDGILQVDALGYADVEKKIPIAADQLLWIASTTKFFTATAMMMLVDEGKVSLDDPIDKYLPEMAENLRVAQQEEDRTVLTKPETMPTVRHALSHQTGLPFLTGMMEKYGGDCLPLQMEVSEISRTPLTFQPGTNFGYSELGPDIAGAIIEKVTGISYEQFMQERIFDPLGMNDTSFWPSKELQETRWIHCYKDGSEPGTLEELDIPLMTRPYESKTTRFPEPGSGIFSTSNDLAKFLQMHAAGGVYQGKRFISEASIREMMSKQTPEGITPYGLGSNATGTTWYGHTGACGNLCYASTEGVARMFIVQVYGTNKYDEAVKAWEKASDEIFIDLGLLGPEGAAPFE